jgi:subtilisin family serine protease
VKFLNIFGRSINLASATAAVIVAPLAVTTAASSTSAAPAAFGPAGRYIVMTSGDPLASYDGGVGNFQGTKPGPGKKLDTRSAAAQRYRTHLIAGHSEALRDAGLPASSRLHDYSVAFNGFVAELTPAQAAQLAKAPAVVRVWKDEQRTADTVSTPRFLGLDGAGGVWQQQFGGDAHAGEGIVVADLDSGIWPENPSFAALPTPRPDQAAIDATWHGTCEVGASDPIACNNKLIGARYYPEGNDTSHDFVSPRDFNGHGSHTASTAAGNHGVPVTINGLGFGDASGMAPAARIAAYKVLWETPDGRASGSTSGIVAAIDDAVSDGADVINYSISGSTQYIVSPDELAFFGAADAGVFVSASAGNNGDSVGVSSVAHNAPWEMTVAASTHDRGANKTVTLGDGSSYTGLGYGPAVGPAEIVDSTASALPGASTTAATRCYSSAFAGAPVLDPAKVTGKIVLCTRGTNARVDKSRAVKEAGGIGMVLIDASPAQSPSADFHSVPSIHVGFTAGQAIKTYVDGNVGSATATISATDTSLMEAPTMAGFSSYGPALAGGGDLLKPDITAPGVGVIAAVAPPNNNGQDWNSYDGTSMSAPHITGIAALIRQKHPTWSPMWVKSALLTNASPLTNRGNPIQRAGHDATPLDFGSGEVQPAPSFDPGLVYDSSALDWIRYGCGIGQIQLVTDPSLCASAGSIDPSDLNYPSIAVAGLAGTQTITRTVTNTSVDQASIYKPVVQAPPGVTVKLSATKLTVPPLKSRTFTMTLTRTSAPLGQWAFGSLTWVDKRGHAARSPIAVQPVALAVPTDTTITGASGSQALSVKPGYTGTLLASVAGLAPAEIDVVPTTLTTDGTVPVTIPAGTKVARFATYDADYPAGTDVDLFVSKDGTEVGRSAGGTAEESVTLTGDDLGGTYSVRIDYFAGAGPSLDVKLNSFAVGTTPAGNLTVTPASQPVTTGTPTAVMLDWSGLDPTLRYLGTISWSDGTASVGRTLVSVLP